MRSVSVPLFAYECRDSPIHRLSTAAKLVALIAIAIVASLGSVAVLLYLTLTLATSFVLAHLDLREIARVGRFALIYSGLIAFFRLVGVSPAEGQYLLDLWKVVALESAIYLWRLSLMLVSSLIFYKTTSGNDLLFTLMAGQARITRILPRRFHIPDLSLLLALTLLFIPRVFDTWDAVDRAWRARGGGLPVKARFLAPVFHYIKKYSLLWPILLIALLDTAKHTDRAMRARG